MERILIIVFGIVCTCYKIAREYQWKDLRGHSNSKHAKKTILRPLIPSSLHGEMYEENSRCINRTLSSDPSSLPRLRAHDLNGP